MVAIFVWEVQGEIAGAISEGSKASKTQHNRKIRPALWDQAFCFLKRGRKLRGSNVKGVDAPDK